MLESPESDDFLAVSNKADVSSMSEKDLDMMVDGETSTLKFECAQPRISFLLA